MKNIIALSCAILLLSVGAYAQPLTNKYKFSFPDTLDVSGNLLRGTVAPAGSNGRLKLDPNGHLSFENGDRFVVVGTTLQWTGQFPDSATAIRMAQRMRALGLNCVRFTSFDYTAWSVASIFADGPTTLGNGLHPAQMKRLDWFIHQLRQNGLYYVFSFHSVWLPRAGDGVRQIDSIGWGTRTQVFFDPVIQNIHRGIIKALLTHINPYTQFAYKDDPAMAYMIAAEDGTLLAYWLYTQDVVRPNSGNANIGSQHLRLMDSLYYAYLKGKGLSTDAQLNAAWSASPTNPQNIVRNNGFEDPFSAAWILGVNGEGSQAVLQLTEADKKEGVSCARIRIGAVTTPANWGNIYMYQPLGAMTRLNRYRISAWLRTSPEKQSRKVRFLVYNGSTPYNSYGVAEEVSITDQWKKFEYEFLCTAIDQGVPSLQIQMGNEMGDVYIDDVQLVEIGMTGLKPGESIANGTLRRSMISDGTVSPKRAKTEADFYFEKVKSFYDGVYRLVRDTLKSDVLLCPSTRLTSAFEFQATKQYDVFSSTDWRNSPQSMLKELYGGSLTANSQAKLKNKALVLNHVAIAYGRPYSQEMATIMPAYAGLHDWDGVCFSIFSSTPRAGNVKVDSANYWEIFDKPNVLALLPGASNSLRNRDVTPSPKVIEITQSQEALDYPRFHANTSYSLGINPDSRMPIFRRVETSTTLGVESLLPHREISALATTADPTALDSENEQIYWDASKGILRVITPNYVAVAGALNSQIVTLPGYIIEQTTAGANAVVTMSSLTPDPINISQRSLLTVATKCQNEDAVFNANLEGFAIWGKAATYCEGVSVRVNVTSAAMDSCIITPLDNTGQPNGTPIVATKTGSRFSFQVNTQSSGTPWFAMRFSKTPTSVDEVAGTVSTMLVYPNPVTDGIVNIRCESIDVGFARIYASTGQVVQTVRLNNGRGIAEISALSAGLYSVRTHTGEVGRFLVK